MPALSETWARIISSGTLAWIVGIVDVAIVAFLIYKVLCMARGNRAWPILTGLGVFALAYWLSGWAGLSTMHWLLQQLVPLGPVAIVILLYPELRHLLENIGHFGLWGSRMSALREEQVIGVIQEVSRAAGCLSQKKVGAIIVIERAVGLEDHIARGTRVEALVSAPMLEAIFHGGSPLHDGAAIIRGMRIIAAGCLLPFSESSPAWIAAHTRHRAALGISEQSDAIAVVVSEETGRISLATEGKLTRGIKEEILLERLSASLLPKRPSEETPEKKRKPTGEAA